MSSRRVDIRTSRKPNPVQEASPVEKSTRVLRTERPIKSSAKSQKTHPKHANNLKKQKTTKKILKKLKVLPKSTYLKHKVVSLKKDIETSNSVDSPDELKPRRRRLDAEDYIKRRFLYEDESVIKRTRNKSNFAVKRIDQLGSRLRTSSTAALMAASSANLLHKKRRRQHDESATFERFATIPPVRNRRGRKPKQHTDYDIIDHEEIFNKYLSPAEHDSETDEQTFSDEGTSPLSGGFSRRTDNLQHHERSLHDSDAILKPLFRKPSKSRSYNHQDHSFSPDGFHNSPDHHFAEFTDLMLQDRMTDLTRTRGPTVLSKRARHRIAPRPMRKPDPIKQVSHYHPGKHFDEFGTHESSDTFHHHSHHHQQQLEHPEMDSIDQFTEDLGEGIEMPPQHRDGTKLGFSLGDGEHSIDMIGMSHHQHPQHPQLLNLTGGALQLPPQPVDVEEFAGDLLPQRITITSPLTGSSRRKSPIRPMQVMRTEPLIYHDPVGDRNSRDARSFMMESMHHQRYIGSSGANLIQQKQLPSNDGFAENQQQQQQPHIHPGLVDLCAAAHGELADMHSAAAAAVVEGYKISPTSSQQQQHQIDFMGQVAGNITSSAVASNMPPQIISVLNPSLVAVQPSRIFVETTGGTTNIVRPALTSYGMPMIKPNLAKYAISYTPNKALTTPSSASGGSIKSTGGSGSNSTRRRPTILKRGVGGGSSASASSSVSISPSTQSQQHLNPQTIISYTSIGNTACLPMLSPANASCLQPPFMRTIGAFTPGASGFHKLSLINSNGAGVAIPSDLASFPDTTISPVGATIGGGGQLLRLVSANNHAPASVTYAVVSSAPLMSTASPSIININSNRMIPTTTQTASSRLFGRKSQAGLTEPHVNPQAMTFISNANLGGSPLLASQRATPLRYTVVRGAADGKKYVLLGPPSNSMQQPENISGMRLNMQADDREVYHNEQQPHQQGGLTEEDVDNAQFTTSWSDPATNAVVDSSVIISSQKSPVSESAVVS